MNTKKSFMWNAYMFFALVSLLIGGAYSIQALFISADGSHVMAAIEICIAIAARNGARLIDIEERLKGLDQ